jgi:hypothetical protein
VKAAQDLTGFRRPLDRLEPWPGEDAQMMIDSPGLIGSAEADIPPEVNV